MYGGIVHCQSWTVDHATSAGTAHKIKATKSSVLDDYQIVIETDSHNGSDSNTIYFVT